MEPSSITIFYLNCLETFSQKTILRKMSKFYMFLEMVSNIRNIDIYFATRYCVFSGTILIVVEGLKPG